MIKCLIFIGVLVIGRDTVHPKGLAFENLRRIENTFS